MKFAVLPSFIRTRSSGSEWMPLPSDFQLSLVSSWNSFLLSSPCREGFCSSFLLHCLGATLTMATWVFVNNTLVTLVNTLLFMSASPGWKVCVTLFCLWRNAGTRREGFDPFVVHSASSIHCGWWFSSSWIRGHSQNLSWSQGLWGKCCMWSQLNILVNVLGLNLPPNQ